MLLLIHDLNYIFKRVPGKLSHISHRRNPINYHTWFPINWVFIVWLQGTHWNWTYQIGSLARRCPSVRHQVPAPRHSLPWHGRNRSYPRWGDPLCTPAPSLWWPTATSFWNLLSSRRRNPWWEIRRHCRVQTSEESRSSGWCPWPPDGVVHLVCLQHIQFI